MIILFWLASCSLYFSSVFAVFYSVCSGNCPFSLQLLFIWAVQNWEAFGKVLSNHNVVVSIFLERRIWNWSSWSQLAELLLWRWYTGRHDAAQAAANVSSRHSLPCQGMGLLNVLCHVLYLLNAGWRAVFLFQLQLGPIWDPGFGAKLHM